MSLLKPIKVLKSSNLPTRLPFLSTSVCFLLFDKYNAPQWLWGAAGLFYILIWITALIRAWNQEEVDLLKNEK